jgi:hypothetical protein
MLSERGVRGLRVLQGLIALAAKHRSGAIDAACELALTHRAFRLKDLRHLMEQPVRQERLELMDEHPLIRNISHYGRFVKVSLRQEENGTNDEFNAWGATSGEIQREEPARGLEQALPAVQPPASALGSLSSGALSSGPANGNLRPLPPIVNEPKGDLG